VDISYWLSSLSQIIPSFATSTWVSIFLGTRVVSYRDGSGRAVVQSAWCPHLGADLSVGRRGEGQIRRAYFNWRFDAASTCMHIPTDDKIPPGAAIFWPRPGGRSDRSTAKPRCSRCRASRRSNSTASPSQHACAASARCRRGSAPATASTSSTCAYRRGPAGAQYNAVPQGRAGYLGSPLRPLFKVCQRVPARRAWSGQPVFLLKPSHPLSASGEGVGGRPSSRPQGEA